MKSVRIKLEVKKRLDKFADGKSTNKAVRELLEGAKTFPQSERKVQEYYNIKIDDELLDKLNCCKMGGESHSDVISRLLGELDF